ncbi:hypothetical protein N509_00393, partial [Brucella abortus BC95]
MESNWFELVTMASGKRLSNTVRMTGTKVYVAALTDERE